MTSYQKLKLKCENLQSQVDIFKGALTVGYIPDGYEELDDGSICFSEKVFVQRMKLLNELEKEELTRWVAFNLDEKSVLRLLEIKKELENEGIN